MNPTTEALCLLLKVALTNDDDVTMPSAIVWADLLNMARSQGVIAIVMHGLQQLMKKGYQPLNLDGKINLEGNLMSLSIERMYERQLLSAVELSNLWHDNGGIRTWVLKGFAFAAYYPVPAKRPASDLDCYLGTQYEAGNRVVEAKGIKVDREDYRHATFQYRHVFVENHKICTTVRGSRQRKRFERYLRSLLANEPTTRIAHSHLELPCDRFNALYFLQHSHRHFLREGITLRYICDWAMMLQHAQCFDTDFWQVCAQNDLLPFAETMTRLAQVVCGVKATWLKPGEAQLQRQDVMLLNDCSHIANNAIKYGNSLKAHLQMVKNMLAMRWKYKYFSNRSMGVELICSVWSNWFEKVPKVD